MSTGLEKLDKLDDIIVDLEKQSKEIESSANVLKKISNIEIKIHKTAELTITATENLSVTLSRYTDFISTLENKIESQNEVINNLTIDTKKQISGFAHDFIDTIEKRIEYQNSIINNFIIDTEKQISEFSHVFTDTIGNKIETHNTKLNDFIGDTDKQISVFTHEFIERVSALRDETLNAHIDLRQDIDRVGKANGLVNDSINKFTEDLSIYKNNNSMDQELHYKNIEGILMDQNKRISLHNNIMFFVAILSVAILSMSIYFKF